MPSCSAWLRAVRIFLIQWRWLWQLDIGFVPGPPVTLNPDLALTLFVPPVLYQAALATSWRDTRENIGSISLLAIGLVNFTTVAVAAVTHFIAAYRMGFGIRTGSDHLAFRRGCRYRGDAAPEYPTAHRHGGGGREPGQRCYRLGAVQILSRRGCSYGVFIARGWSGVLLIGAGGVAIGLAFGSIFVKLQRYLADPLIESTYSLILPFTVYISAQYLGVSGVLAVVAAGLIRGHYYSEILSARTRIQALGMWEIVVFILNSLSFVLIGLQLHGIMPLLYPFSMLTLIGGPAAISLVVIVSRMLWVFAMAYLPRLFHQPHPDVRATTVVAWTGMRGIVSLATALALPLKTAAGENFPGREFIIFFSFVVILATLVLQGLSLGPLIRWLGLRADSSTANEEAAARLAAARAALVALAKFADDRSIDPEMLHWVRADYEHRIANLHEKLDQSDRAAKLDEAGKSLVMRDGGADFQLRRLRLAAVAAQRHQIIEMRNVLLIADEVMHLIERELDLEELELG